MRWDRDDEAEAAHLESEGARAQADTEAANAQADPVRCGCDEYPECTHALYWHMGFKAGEVYAKIAAGREEPAIAARVSDLVEETRRQLQPYLKIEAFPTDSKPLSYLAVDTILQAAFERVAAPSKSVEQAATAGKGKESA